MENQPLSLQKHVLPIAFIASLVRVIIDLIPRFFELGFIAYYSTFFLCFIAEFILIFIVVKNYRKLNTYLSLKEAFKIGIILMLIIGIFYSISATIYDTFIDPYFQMRNTLEFVEQVNPNAVEQTKAKIEESEGGNPLLGVALVIIWFTFIGFIISLITGLILKKSPNDY